MNRLAEYIVSHFFEQMQVWCSKSILIMYFTHLNTQHSALTLTL